MSTMETDAACNRTEPAIKDFIWFVAKVMTKIHNHDTKSNAAVYRCYGI